MHILLVARHYPPEVSGGARRPKLIADGLRNIGHKVTVCSPFPLEYEPGQIVVPVTERHQSRPPQEEIQPHWFSRDIKKHFRDLLYWPEPNIIWARAVLASLSRELVQPDLVITTAPPESLNVIGAKLAAKLKCKWVADVRDTWIKSAHRPILHQSPVRRSLERRIARQSFKNADAILAVSSVVRDEILDFTDRPIPNHVMGHFSIRDPDVTELPTDSINLVHCGGFTHSDFRRKLRPLLELLSHCLPNELPLRLVLAGRLSAEERKTIKSDWPFLIDYFGEISLRESRALQNGADGLLLYAPEDCHALPGKFAEYRQARRPILWSGKGPWVSKVDGMSGIWPLEEALPVLEKLTTTEPPLDFNMTVEIAKLDKFLRDLQFKPGPRN